MRKLACVAALLAAAMFALAWPALVLAAQLTVTSTAHTGTALTLSSAAAGGDAFVNDSSGRTFFVVTNGGGSPINVNITPNVASVAVQGFGTLSIANAGGSVTNGTTRIFGPFPTHYNDASGNVNIGYTNGVTSVTVGVFKIPSP